MGLGGLWYKLEAQVGGGSWQEDVEMVRYKVDPGCSVGSWVLRWILGTLLDPWRDLAPGRGVLL